MRQAFRDFGISGFQHTYGNPKALTASATLLIGFAFLCLEAQ
jgi:hypothetical protein